MPLPRQQRYSNPVVTRLKGLASRKARQPLAPGQWAPSSLAGTKLLLAIRSITGRGSAQSVDIFPNPTQVRSQTRPLLCSVAKGRRELIICRRCGDSTQKPGSFIHEGGSESKAVRGINEFHPPHCGRPHTSGRDRHLFHQRNGESVRGF